MVCTRFTYDVHMIYKWLLYDTRWCGVRSQGSSVRECCGVTIPWVHIVARPCNYKVFQHIVGCDTAQLQSVAGLLSGYERRRSASILFCQLCQIFTFVGFCQIFTQPQRSLNSSSTFSENRGTNGEWVESSNGNDVTKIVTKRLFSIEIGLVTAKEVTRNSYTALST